MGLVTMALNFSAASQLIALAPLSIATALLAGRCGERVNVALDILSLALSAAMAGVLFHAVDGAQTGLMRYAYYLAAGPMLLALWAADGLLHRLTVSTQRRNHTKAAGSIAIHAQPVAAPLVDDVYPQLYRG